MKSSGFTPTSIDNEYQVSNHTKDCTKKFRNRFQWVSGFTLIELLVVIAIIGVLAAIIISSLGSARMQAKDVAVISSVSNLRASIELEYEGGPYFGLCGSTLYEDIETYIEGQGGSVTSCVNENTHYRIIVELPSSVALGYLFPLTVYADGEDGYCINSNGFGAKVIISDALLLVNRYCSLDEPGAEVWEYE